MGLFGGKRGSAAVFLTAITISMISAALVIDYAARDISVNSQNDARFRLAGNGILAEYDLRLIRDYGIFAFRGFNDEIEDKLRFYMQDGEWDTISASGGSYCLASADNFERSVLDCMEFELAMTLLKESAGQAEEISANRLTEAEQSGLPSGGLGGSAFSALQLKNMGERALADKASDTFLTDTYILTHFRTRLGNVVRRGGRLAYEAEYVLFGKPSDAGNAEAFRGAFSALRLAMNSAFAQTDPEMQSQTMALAELLTPGPEAVITQRILLEIWAAAETVNDVRLIENGNRVSFVKGQDTWALSLDQAVKIKKKKNEDGEDQVELTQNDAGFCVPPPFDRGLLYREYLRLFLYAEDREQKLLRMMDIIEINLRSDYYGSFLLKEYNTGFSLKAEWGRHEYDYEFAY